MNSETTIVKTKTLITSPASSRVMIPANSTTTKKQMLLFLGGDMEEIAQRNYDYAIEQGWIEELTEEPAR